MRMGLWLGLVLKGVWETRRKWSRSQGRKKQEKKGRQAGQRSQHYLPSSLEHDSPETACFTPDPTLSRVARCKYDPHVAEMLKRVF